MNFSMRNFIKSGFLKAIGKTGDYWVILNAAGWFDKGVLLEEDLVEIQSAIDAHNAATAALSESPSGADADPPTDSPDGNAATPTDSPDSDGATPTDSPDSDAATPTDSPDGNGATPTDSPDSDAATPADSPDGNAATPENPETTPQ